LTHSHKKAFFLTAHFSEDDYPYDLLMPWLSCHPEWQRCHEFETTTRISVPGFSAQADNSFGDDDDGEENDDELCPCVITPWAACVASLPASSRLPALLIDIVGPGASPLAPRSLQRNPGWLRPSPHPPYFVSRRSSSPFTGQLLYTQANEYT